MFFPAGAVATSHAITVQQTGQTSPGGAPIFLFGPAGAQFARPVEVTLPLPSGLTGAVSVYWSKLGSATQYDALAATAVTGAVKASVTHFSTGFVGPGCTQGAACTVPGTACQAGTLDCSTGAPVCAGLAAVADGTSCGGANVCRAGACVAACVPGQACQPATADPCHTHLTGCNAALTATTCDRVLPLQNGTSCGADQVCSGGSCVACAAGGACTSTNPCHTAAFSCSTGSQVCADTGDKANGTSCAGGVCGGGACNPCAPGAACVSANPCHTANEVCTSGFRVCADSGNQPSGTACGSGLVCDASASCIAACLAGQPCAGADPCRTYQTACSADLAQPASCIATADRADGTACGGGLVCAGGACGCNTVALGSAPAVTPTLVAQAAPSPTGGTVLDGTYHLTAMTVYTGPGGASGPVQGEQRSQVFLLSGGPYQVLEVRNGAVFRSNGTYALFGSRLVHRATCGSSETQDQGYSASGAEVRIFDTSKPNETLVMLLVRQGPTCIDGQACTVASPDACKVYGMTCDAAHASGTCGALANAPVGTPCGASSACDATGACAASSTRTVSGTWRSTWWLDSGARLDVDELVGASDSVAAITGSGASATRIPGTLLPNGTFAIPGVPFGAYVLELVRAGLTPLYVEETESALDLGVDWMGRPDAELAAAQTPVTFQVSGLAPWTPGDGFVVTAPNVSRGPAGSLGPISAGLAAGATAGSFWYEAQSAGNSLRIGLVDTQKGDQLWIHQMVTGSRSTSHGAAPYLAAGPYAHLTSGVTVQSGVATSVGSTQAPIALLPPPATGSAPIDFRGTQFAAHGPSVNPIARRTGVQQRISVQASARGLTRPLPENYGDYVPLRVPLLSLDLGSAAFYGTDTDFGTLSYGSGIHAGFPEWRLMVRTIGVPFVAPGATSSFTINSGLGRADAMPAPNPVVPALTPPLTPLVNGEDARTFQGDIGLTPTLAWLPPAVGTPAVYQVQIFDLAAAGGATAATEVARYRTGAAGFTVPPGILRDGRTYVFHIQAFASDHPTSELLTTPRRRGMTPAWGFAVTGLLRTCSTGNCPACVEGGACSSAPPGGPPPPSTGYTPCQVGALSCANGFLCVLTPSPDGTDCAPGQVCRAGNCVADASGTWTGTYSRSGVRDGVSYSDSSHSRAHALVQSGGSLAMRFVDDSPARGRLSCTQSGGNWSCQGDGSSGTCAFTVSATLTLLSVWPPTLVYGYTTTFAGGSCTGTETGSATLQKRLSAGAVPSLAGSYTVTGSFTNTPPGTGSTASSGTAIVSQVGNSLVSDYAASTGSTTTCVGWVDGTAMHRLCAGASGACAFAGTSEATYAAGPPPSFDTAYTFHFGGSCGGLTSQTGTQTATQDCAGEACPRTVSGRFATTFWPDTGSPTVVATAKPAGTTVSALVPGATGYTSYPGTLAGDGSFTIPGVPAGAYFLQVVEGGVPSLYQLTTSTPDMRTLRSARADVARATASTPVTINYTNLLPFNRNPNDQLWMTCSQAELDVRVVPDFALPARSATSASPAFDFFSSLAPGVPRGLPEAAKGDAVYLFQRRATALPDGPSGTQVLRKAERYVRLAGATGATVTSGAAATIDAPVVDAPLSQMSSADVRTTQFAALAPAVNPAASTSAVDGAGFFAGLGAQPHAVAYPAPTAIRMRLLGLFLDLQAPDTAYPAMSYGGFLDGLWKEWWTAGATFMTPFTAAGAGPSTFATGINSDYLPPVDAVTIAPQQGPVAAPLINGADAFTARTGVGAEPTLSWSAPGLGVPSSYTVRIHEVRNAGGTTDFPLVFNATVRGTSLRVPPGLLVAGSTYLAVIQAFQAPWDLLDAPPLLLGAPAHWAEAVTSTFSP